MRKYQQLLLAILSLFSFSCLLIYRHEYNKLRYVLEVLNFFGTPGIPAVNSSRCIDIDSVNVFARGPSPAWQRIGDPLYIYSAFWEKSSGTTYVKAYAVGTLKDTGNYQCHLWYEENPKKTMGLFDYSELKFLKQDFKQSVSSHSNKKALALYCKPQTNTFSGAPIGVTFFLEKNQTNFGFIPVFSVKSSIPPQNSTGVCIMPTQLPKFNRTMYLEFISFHKLIGIDHFIVYGSTGDHNLLSSLQTDRTNDLKLTVLPWNYPFYDNNSVMKMLAEDDCKTRFKGLLDNLVILDWNTFLVPHYISNISKLLNELGYKNKVNKYLITTLLFCTDYIDESPSNSTLPMIFRKFKYLQPKIDSYIPIYKPHLEFGMTQKIRKNIISVHKYSTCGYFNAKLQHMKTEVDATMLKFKTEYLHSQMHSFKSHYLMINSK